MVVAYNSPNVVATINAVTCVAGNTPQYNIRVRTNDGAWGAYSAWGVTMVFSQAAVQGVKYGFQSQARCHNDVSDSSYATSSESTYVHPITISPTGTPTASSTTPGSITTFTWAAVTCSAGTASYQYRYVVSTGYDSGWVGTASRSVAQNTSVESSTYTLNVQARCATAYSAGPWTAVSATSYVRPRSLVATYNISSTAQAQSTIQNIPNLVAVTGVSVNTGTVSHSVSGNNVTLNVNSGTASTGSSSVWNSTKYSSVKSSTYGPQSGTSFPSSISYNDGSYSGTLYYNNYTTNSSSSQTWNSYKYSKTGTSTTGPQASTSFPSSKAYNDGSYSGTVYYNNYTTGSSSSQVWNATKYSQTLTNWVNWQVGSAYAPTNPWPYNSGGYTGNVYFSGWTSTPSGYGRNVGQYYTCANEGGTCSISSAQDTRYGADSRWIYRGLNGTFSCSTSTYGSDPASGTVKSCQARYADGWYATPPGTPIYLAMYSGTVYQGGYDTTTTYNYTGNYSGTVYQGGYDTTYTYTYTGNYSGTTYMGGYDTVSTTTYPYTITVNYQAY